VALRLFPKWMCRGRKWLLECQLFLAMKATFFLTTFISLRAEGSQFFYFQYFIEWLLGCSQNQWPCEAVADQKSTFIGNSKTEVGRHSSFSPPSSALILKRMGCPFSCVLSLLIHRSVLQPYILPMVIHSWVLDHTNFQPKFKTIMEPL